MISTKKRRQLTRDIAATGVDRYEARCMVLGLCVIDKSLQRLNFSEEEHVEALLAFLAHLLHEYHSMPDDPVLLELEILKRRDEIARLEGVRPEDLEVKSAARETLALAKEHGFEDIADRLARQLAVDDAEYYRLHIAGEA